MSLCLNYIVVDLLAEQQHSHTNCFIGSDTHRSDSRGPTPHLWHAKTNIITAVILPLMAHVRKFVIHLLLESVILIPTWVPAVRLVDIAGIRGLICR
jgi:hypothetical protein